MKMNRDEMVVEAHRLAERIREIAQLPGSDIAALEGVALALDAFDQDVDIPFENVDFET